MLTPFPITPTDDATRVLGVDTALRKTGLGVVAADGSRVRTVWHGTVRTAPGRPLSECLLNLRQGVTRVLDALSPTAVAIEGVFFCKFARTALLLGHARGVVIACCAEAGLPVYEYEPRKVKQAVTGYGAASKPQMQSMMRQLLSLEDPLPEDEADALALALCHLHHVGGVAALAPEPL